MSIQGFDAIPAGADEPAERSRMIDEAQVVVALVSADLLADEGRSFLDRALARASEGTCRLVPVLVRPVSLEGNPLTKLQMLPDNGMPLILWRNQESALVKIVEGLHRIMKNLTERPPVPSESGASPWQKLWLNGSTEIAITDTKEPWRLPVDALVLPCGSRGLGGGLVLAFDEATGQGDEVAQVIAAQLQDRPLRPDTPILIHSDKSVAGLSPQRFIAATVFEQLETPSVANTRVAARAVVRLAHQNKLRTIAFPLLGTGDGGLQPEEVVVVMLDSILDEVQECPLERIVLITLSHQALPAAQAFLAAREGQRQPSEVLEEWLTQQANVPGLPGLSAGKRLLEKPALTMSANLTETKKTQKSAKAPRAARKTASAKTRKAIESTEAHPLRSPVPVVAVMGQAAHGKTMLLFAIWKKLGRGDTAVWPSSTFKVTTSAGELAFLDMPSPGDFDELFHRGGPEIDIVLLVVAADEGITAKTRAAFRYADKVGLPVVVAVTKIDLPNAKPNQVGQQLAAYQDRSRNVFIGVSALTGQGIDQLIDTLVQQSSRLPLRAHPIESAEVDGIKTHPLTSDEIKGDHGLLPADPIPNRVMASHTSPNGIEFRPPSRTEPRPPNRTEPNRVEPSPEPPVVKPKSRDFHLCISSGQCQFLDGDNVLWERTPDPPVAWQAAFQIGGRSFELQKIRRELSNKWDESMVREFGQQLAERLFGGAPPPAVQAALALTSGENRRLIFELEGTATGVPWEYLYLGNIFLLQRRISVVRHVQSESGAAGELCLNPLPQDICFAFATAGGDSYAIDEYVPRLTAALGRFSGGSSKCCHLPYVDGQQLGEALQRPATQVLHFLGHGQAGSLCLHDHDRKKKAAVPKSGADLAQLLGETGHVRFVFLCACYTGSVPSDDEVRGVAETIVAQTGIPVVAMQLAVRADYANEFALFFYQKLAESGYDIERAVYEARKFTESGRSSFGIPVLFADFAAAPRLAPLSEPAQPEFRPLVIQVQRADWEKSLAELPLDLQPAARQALEQASAGNELVPGPRRKPVPAPPTKPEDAPLLTSLRDLLRAQDIPLPVDLQDRIDRADARRQAAPPWPLASSSEPIRVAKNPEFISPTAAALHGESFARLREFYSFPESLIRRIITELASGRHVLLTGPVGTGKTTLAREIISALGYAAKVVTASADWTNHDVVGGFWPTGTGSGAVEFTFRPGPFVEAVMQNWSIQESDEHTPPHWNRAAQSESRGVWLVIDEFNRADMDRALGGLFTALETRELLLPTSNYAGSGPATQVLPIPADFRIFCTLNTVDRHYLFPISDALKRRLAFIEVPVTTEWGQEWQRLERQAGPEPPFGTDLRRFVYLVRLVRPLGTAQLLAARRYLAKAAELEAGQLSTEPPSAPAERLSYAIISSILPTLEDIEEPLLDALLAWAEGVDAAVLAGHLAVLQQRHGTSRYYSRQARALEACGLEPTPPVSPAARLVRQQLAGPLDLLVEHLERLRVHVA